MSANKFTVLVLVAFVSACGGMQDSTPRAKSYILPSAKSETAKNRTGRIIMVETPATAPGLDSSRIALQRGSMVDYFAGIKWAEPLPKVVQAAIVESLENTGRIKAAGTESSGIMPSHTMRLEIRDFQADYGSGEAPIINIKIIGRLLQSSNHSMLKQFTITAEAEAKSNSRTHIMEAFEQAFIAAQDELLTKTLGK